MKTKDDILAALRGHLEELFEVPPAAVVPDAHLFDDLDLDSLDAVDLVVKLQEVTGRRIAPSEFKSVRTVADVVDKIHALVER